MNQPVLTFCGASGEVSGSCYHVRSTHSQIVIDCGAFQGSRYAETRNSLPFPFDPKKLDAVLITHAHFDHVGRLPKLIKEGFRGPIFATTATAELAELTLLDSAHLIAEESRRHGTIPLFTEQDVHQLSQLWRPLTYHAQIKVAPDICVTAVNAGHILGSSSFLIDVEGCRIAFSGDLGNTPAPLLNNTEYLHGAHIALIESTYGTRTHEPSAERESILKDALEVSIDHKGTLIIPAFAVERSQELLYILRSLMREHPELSQPVYLDSPLAVRATEVFEHHHELLMSHEHTDRLFTFPQLNITETAEQSKQINSVTGAHIIIAGSGMMNGGRVLHHLSAHLNNPADQLLILGYQADGTLGQRLQQGEDWVKIYSDYIRVQASVLSSGVFSGHADRPKLLRWVEEIRSHSLQHVYVVHGEHETSIEFAKELRDSEGISASVPEFEQSTELIA